jgi:hypothetical protein
MLTVLGDWQTGLKLCQSLGNRHDRDDLPGTES